MNWSKQVQKGLVDPIQSSHEHGCNFKLALMEDICVSMFMHAHKFLFSGWKMMSQIHGHIYWQFIRSVAISLSSQGGGVGIEERRDAASPVAGGSITQLECMHICAWRECLDEGWPAPIALTAPSSSRRGADICSFWQDLAIAAHQTVYDIGLFDPLFCKIMLNRMGFQRY